MFINFQYKIKYSCNFRTTDDGKFLVANKPVVEDDIRARDMRTNNVVEGYNHAFSLSLPSRATEWTVIDRFKAEESTSKTILHQAAIENDTGESIRNRANEKRDRDLQLQNLIKNSPNLTRKDYLEKMFNCFYVQYFFTK